MSTSSGVWATATTMSAPFSRSSFALARAVSMVEENLMVPGLDAIGVSSVVRPKKATLMPCTSTILSGLVLAGRPLPSTMLVASTSNLASAMRARKAASPRSNSWLPGAMASTPMRFRMSMTWAPLSKPDRSEGEIVSPAWTKKALPFAFSSLMTVASLAKPPRPFSGLMRSMSLVWTKRIVTASCARAVPDSSMDNPRNPARNAAEGRL